MPEEYEYTHPLNYACFLEAPSRYPIFVGSCVIHLTTIALEMPMEIIIIMHLKIKPLKSKPNPSGYSRSTIMRLGLLTVPMLVSINANYTKGWNRCMLVPFSWVSVHSHCLTHSHLVLMYDVPVWFSACPLIHVYYVAAGPSFHVIRCRKYSPSRWLEQMVTMVATGVPGGMTRVTRQFRRTCHAYNSRNMFQILLKLSWNTL